MGNKTSRSSRTHKVDPEVAIIPPELDFEVDPHNPYANCYKLSQIPLIDQTDEIKAIVWTNALGQIPKLSTSEIKELIQHRWADFKVEHICQLVHSRDLYNAYTDCTTKLSLSVNDMVKIIEACILGKNEDLAKVYLKLTLKRGYSNVQKLHVLNFLVDHDYPDLIIIFNQAHPIQKHDPLCPKQMLEFPIVQKDVTALIYKLLNKKVSEKILTNLKNLLDLIEPSELFKIYTLTLQLKIGSVYPAMVFNKINLDSTLIYYVCDHKLLPVACDIFKKDLRRHHFEHNDHNILELIMDNDWFDLFKAVVTKYFANSGKLVKENQYGVLGRCYLKAQEQHKDLYMQILRHHVIFEPQVLQKPSPKAYEVMELSITGRPSFRSDFINEPSGLQSETF